MDQGMMTAVPMPRILDFFIKHTTHDGRVLEGTFTTKKLSIKGMAGIQVRKVQLNGGYYFDEKKPGMGIDEETDWTNYMIAHLEQSLIRKPTWWNLDELDDLDLILSVFKKVATFENSFASPLRGAAVIVQGSPVDSGGSSEGSGAAGRVAAVGGGQVQASLDP